MQENVELIKQFCKYYELRDKESYLKLCDDNIVWISTRAEGGMCVGKKQMFDEYLPQFHAQFKKFYGIHEEFLDAGENVVVLGKYQITSNTDENFESPFAQIYTIKNGKIVKFRQYTDSATVERAKMLQI
ncbi:MAG: nuclear transport factor 2 family protein [Nitrosotalea sp.]